MILATQITLLVFAVFFCLMALSTKAIKSGVFFAGSAAGLFILLLVSLIVLR